MKDERNSRIKKWIKGERQPPYKIIMFPTSICNLRCRFCKSRKFLDEELSDNEWLDIVEEGIDMGVREWWITGGGEPFIRKELILEIVKRIKESGGYCDLMTNGTLLERKDIEDLVDLGLDRVLISINGPQAEVDDFLRGKKGAFKETIDSLEMFKDIKDLKASDKPIVQISSVVNSKNYKILPELYELAKHLDADELELHQMLVYEETSDKAGDLKLSNEEISDLRDILKSLEGDDSMRFDYSALELSISEQEKRSSSQEEDSAGKYFCFQPFYTLLIDMLGEVAPCCPGGSRSQDVNLTERGLEKVWYGDYLTKIRDKIKRGERMGFCQNCGVNNLREDVLEEFNR